MKKLIATQQPNIRDMSKTFEPSLFHQMKTFPNMLSILRLLLVPVFLVLIISGSNLWAIGVLFLSGLTDYLDGYIARRFNQITRLGQLLDPAADRLYIFATLLGLTVTNHIPVLLMAVVIARDVMLLIVYPILATHGYGPLPVHYLGKAGTFSLLYSFPLLLMADIWHNAEIIILPIAWAFALWGVGLYWWAGFVYVKQVRQVVKSSRAVEIG